MEDLNNGKLNRELLTEEERNYVDYSALQNKLKQEAKEFMSKEWKEEMDKEITELLGGNM
jgi:SPX domain protein involved in polyphosphate accumulation